MPVRSLYCCCSAAEAPIHCFSWMVVRLDTASRRVYVLRARSFASLSWHQRCSSGSPPPTAHAAEYKFTALPFYSRPHSATPQYDSVYYTAPSCKCPVRLYDNTPLAIRYDSKADE